MGVLYLLFESASGYALFERVAAEEITPKAEDVTDLKKFSAIVKLKGAHTNSTTRPARSPTPQRHAGCNCNRQHAPAVHSC